MRGRKRALHILVITHAQDEMFRQQPSGGVASGYMLGPILQKLAETGHKITIRQGLPNQPLPADLAIVHVDLTMVPADYLAFGASYPMCVNLAVADISKRAVSGALLRKGWDGPVIVKSNFNFRAIPELRLNRAEVSHHERYGYEIYDSPSDVPAGIADDPALVIERFLPERVDGGYAVRFWTFSGDAERCSRVFSAEPIVKASNQTGFEFVAVPDRLREIRTRLGFDYGKFDFVMHDGEPILIDANKTPGAPPVPKGSTWPQDYAAGLLRLARS